MRSIQPGLGAGSPASPEPYITKSEVALRLGVTLRTLNNWMRRQLIPYYKANKTVRFKWSEIESALLNKPTH